jgi:hypothetical protein
MSKYVVGIEMMCIVIMIKHDYKTGLDSG